MKKRIRLMAEYSPSALWMEGGMAEYEDIPIDQMLVDKINNWNGTYCAWLDWEDPGNSPEPPQEEVKEFDREGIQIWQQLINEIGHEYEVIYFGHYPGLEKHGFDSIEEYIGYCSSLS